MRHGETLANRAGIIQGQSESPLSELGASQAGLVAKALAGVDWWRIVSSDLGRCQQTAKILLEAADGAGNGSAPTVAIAERNGKAWRNGSCARRP